MNETDLKEVVRHKYAEIAKSDKTVNAASCCGATAASQEVYNIMTDDYSSVDGYAPDADLGLGCGLPTACAQISEGDTIIDLGSGAGNDCFVARHACGSSGKVIGIDFTEEMIARARINADKLGYNNVEFRHGDIEQMPVAENTADVVVSNCVLNLVPNKRAVIGEILRVLKPGGHFSISDIVLVGELPSAFREDAELYAGCVSGAIQKEDYIKHITELGFNNITIQKEKAINIPVDILEKHLLPEDIAEFKSGQTGIYSITVYAEKPGASRPKQKIKLADLNQNQACEPGSGCC